MGRNGVTIQDVARESGVSKVTVSYVLNGRESRFKISDNTKQVVFRAAKELGYHPNALARGLAGRQTNTLALVLQYPSVFSGWSGFTNELMHGATDAACALGYDLLLHTKAQPDLDQEVAALTDGRVDGALLLRDRDDLLGERLAARTLPHVHIFSRGSDAESCFVDCDNFLGGKMATEYLLGLGHWRICHLAGSSHSAAAMDRRDGYRMALANVGIAPDPNWEWEITYAGSDFDPFLTWMAGNEAATAVFAWSDDAAIRAMRLLREHLGKRVPEDIAVVGFDGTEKCEHTQPRLTSVRQPIYEMAAQGVEILISKIQKKESAMPQVLMPPTLAVRESCGASQKEKTLL